MDLRAELRVGEYRLRTLTPLDAALVVEATVAEQAPAAWGPRPAGPYTLDEAVTALREWDPDTAEQASIGVFDGGRLVGALGLMPDGPSSAELGYWVRPEYRGRGIAWRCVVALTGWAQAGTAPQVHRGLPSPWLTFIVTLAGMFLARGLCYVISVDSISIDNALYVKLAQTRIPLPGGLRRPVAPERGHDDGGERAALRQPAQRQAPRAGLRQAEQGRPQPDARRARGRSIPRRRPRPPRACRRC